MNDISNRALALLLVSAIVISLGATVYTLNKLESSKLPTGMAQSGLGTVNLTVESTLSILMQGLTIIDFGKGYVNSSCTYPTFANLTVNDLGYTDNGDCWTSMVSPPNQPNQPFRIENDGNKNATLAIACPAPGIFFSGYTGGNAYNLSFKGRNNKTNSCRAANLNSKWTICGSYGTGFQNICNETAFNYAPSGPTGNDEIAVDINIVIPDGLGFQEYKNSTITFRAT